MKLKYYLRGLGIGMLVVALVLVASGKVGAKMSDEAVKRRAEQLGMVEKDQTVLGDIVGEDLPPQENAEGQAGTEAPEGSAAAPAETETPLDQALESTEAGTPEGNEQKPAETPEGDGAAAETADAPKGGETKPAEAEATEESAKKPADGNAQPEGQAAGQAPETAKPETPAGQQEADPVADRAAEVAENAPKGRTVTLEVRRGDSSVSVAERAAEIGLVRSAKEFDAFLCQNGYDKKISVGNYEITEGSSEKDIADIITKRR